MKPPTNFGEGHGSLPRLSVRFLILVAFLCPGILQPQPPGDKAPSSSDRQIAVEVGDPSTLPARNPAVRQWLVLIAIDDYANNEFLPDLSSCQADAVALRDLLFARFGYDKDHTVELFGSKATEQTIRRTLYDLIQRVAAADSVLILFSGHGYYQESTRMGFWYSYDAGTIADGISNSTVRDWCGGFQANKVLVISDSCFAGSLLNTKGLQSDVLRKSREILASGGLHPVADAGSPDGRHSVFTYYLLQALERLAARGKPFVTTQVYVDLYTPVLNNSRQEPKRGAVRDTYDEGGQFLFYPASTPTPTVAPPPKALDVPDFKTDDLDAAERKRRDEETARAAAEAAAKKSREEFVAKAREGYRTLTEKDDSAWLDPPSKARKWGEFLDAFSGKDDEVDRLMAGEFQMARERRDHWTAWRPPTPAPAVASAASSTLSTSSTGSTSPHPETGAVKTIDLGGGISMNLVYIRGGSFTMGSPSNEKERGSDENQVQVTLTKDFWIGETEVTQAQYQAVMGSNPSYFEGGRNLPVEEVSWEEAVSFCVKLSQKSKLKFELPTEAQWEYACRAGSTTRFCFGDSDSGLGDYAWYSSNSSFQTYPVKTKKPNAWGLYDMHGNVWEWCSGWYGDSLRGGADPTGASSGSYRVDRGGGWGHESRYCRSASRSGLGPGFRYFILGFRVLAPVQ